MMRPVHNYAIRSTDTENSLAQECHALRDLLVLARNALEAIQPDAPLVHEIDFALMESPSIAHKTFTGESVNVPAHVYYSPDADNFYDKETRRGMGNDFYNLWWMHTFKFPTS